ncbi:MAG: hypothetical protein RL066_733 [Actinomycetota bacterium]
MIELAASFDTQFASIAPFFLYLVVGAIVFVETGILLGFFLPGDSILFSAGLVAAAHGEVNIVILVSVIFIAAFFGDQVGFVLGRLVGRPYLERHKSPRIQNVPPIAGISKMNYYKFLSANALGALLWGVGITLAGYYAATLPWVKTSSYAIAAFFITASLVSSLVNYLRHRR